MGLSSIFEMSTTWTKPFLQPASTKIMNPAPFMGKLINDFNRGQNLSDNFKSGWDFLGGFELGRSHKIP